MIHISIINSFPVGNPFDHDSLHMGTEIGTNVMIMHKRGNNQYQNYIIVCNTETGERMLIDFNDRAGNDFAQSKMLDSIIKEKKGNV